MLGGLAFLGVLPVNGLRSNSFFIFLPPTKKGVATEGAPLQLFSMPDESYFAIFTINFSRFRTTFNA